MTARIIELPRDWYRFASCNFYLSSINLNSVAPATGRRSVSGPNSQLWRAQLTMTTQDRDVWMAIEGMFAELAGSSGLLRMADPSRRAPQWDLDIAAGREAFSDGSFFTDGTGFSEGTLSPNIFAVEAADRGDTSMVVGGLPESSSRVLRRGDHFEVRRNGMADETPSLHIVVRNAPTDADGQTRLEFRPALRKGVAMGDQIALRYPSTVFRLADDAQGIVERTPPNFGALGFGLIEALV